MSSSDMVKYIALGVSFSMTHSKNTSQKVIIKSKLFFYLGIFKIILPITIIVIPIPYSDISECVNLFSTLKEIEQLPKKYCLLHKYNGFCCLSIYFRLNYMSMTLVNWMSLTEPWQLTKFNLSNQSKCLL